MIFGLQPISPADHPPSQAGPGAACARLHGQGFAHPWSAEEIAALIAEFVDRGAAALDPVNGRLRGFACLGSRRTKRRS